MAEMIYEKVKFDAILLPLFSVKNASISNQDIQREAHSVYLIRTGHD